MRSPLESSPPLTGVNSAPLFSGFPPSVCATAPAAAASCRASVIRRRRLFAHHRRGRTAGSRDRTAGSRGRTAGSRGRTDRLPDGPRRRRAAPGPFRTPPSSRPRSSSPTMPAVASDEIEPHRVAVLPLITRRCDRARQIASPSAQNNPTRSATRSFFTPRRCCSRLRQTSVGTMHYDATAPPYRGGSRWRTTARRHHTPFALADSPTGTPGLWSAAESCDIAPNSPAPDRFLRPLKQADALSNPQIFRPLRGIAVPAAAEPGRHYALWCKRAACRFTSSVSGRLRLAHHASAPPSSHDAAPKSLSPSSANSAVSFYFIRLRHDFHAVPGHR